MNFVKYYDLCYVGIIGPALGAGALGCIIGITSPITIPVAILCSPSILYRMFQDKK